MHDTAYPLSLFCRSQDEDLAAGVSRMDIGGGERFDVGDHSGSGTRAARERRGEISFEVDDDDDDDDNDGRFGAGGGGGRSPVGGGSRGEYGDGGGRGDRGRGYGDDGDDDGHDRRYRGGGGAYGDDDEVTLLVAVGGVRSGGRTHGCACRSVRPLPRGGWRACVLFF